MAGGCAGGQSKRTNIGLALVTNPRVLFLDEPTSGLDSFTANEVSCICLLSIRTLIWCTFSRFLRYQRSVYLMPVTASHWDFSVIVRPCASVVFCILQLRHHTSTGRQA